MGPIPIGGPFPQRVGEKGPLATEGYKMDTSCAP